MKRKVYILFGIIFITFVFTFLVSRTYAKYISSIDSTDEARVAKWDINMTKGIDLFKDSYLNEANEEIVKSKNGDKVVAPGTSGQYTFTIAGAPETNYKLKIDVLDSIDTIGKLTYNVDGIFSTTDIKDLAWYLTNMHNRQTVYPANKKINFKHTISWEWEFYKNDDEDKTDTEKGEAAITDKSASGYDEQAMVKLKIRVIAEQTDEKATS